MTSYVFAFCHFGYYTIKCVRCWISHMPTKNMQTVSWSFGTCNVNSGGNVSSLVQPGHIIKTTTYWQSLTPIDCVVNLPEAAIMSLLNSHGYSYFDNTSGVYTSGGGLDSGDTAWMLTSTALVLLMTMPGLAIYYSGMVRDKNVLACKSYQ